MTLVCFTATFKPYKLQLFTLVDVINVAFAAEAVDSGAILGRVKPNSFEQKLTA